ncbi:MAG: hypothetical protein AAF252_01295 [Pseudomonadota bacterium]
MAAALFCWLRTSMPEAMKAGKGRLCGANGQRQSFIRTIDSRVIFKSGNAHRPVQANGSASLSVAPLALTRIMSNLVQNSIQHSRGNKIVIGL